jgi:hypothetical protein
LEIGNAINLLSLLATLVLGTAIPFAERPMLGYETNTLSEPNQLLNIELSIGNQGITKLTNVVTSFNTKIINVTTIPFFPDPILKTDLNNSENTFLKIGILPPQAWILVKLELNSSVIENDTLPTPYLAADEWRGYPSWYNTSVNFAALGAGGFMTYLTIRMIRRL